MRNALDAACVDWLFCGADENWHVFGYVRDRMARPKLFQAAHATRKDDLIVCRAQSYRLIAEKLM